MKLVRLSNGRLSGEFADQSWLDVKQILSSFGTVSAETMADVLMVKVDAAALVFTDEWDESALIAINDAGDSLLEAIEVTERKPGHPRRNARQWSQQRLSVSPIRASARRTERGRVSQDN